MVPINPSKFHCTLDNIESRYNRLVVLLQFFLSSSFSLWLTNSLLTNVQKVIEFDMWRKYFMNIVVMILLHFLEEEIGFVSFNYIKFVII